MNIDKHGYACVRAFEEKVEEKKQKTKLYCPGINPRNSQNSPGSWRAATQPYTNGITASRNQLGR